MAKLNMENVWQFMEKYDFNKENEIEKELLCTLCKKILINAHISPCTCRFCFGCISDYLNKEQKACPGYTNECKMELISLNNIVVDYAINNKIMKLIVKCPEKSCEFKDEMRNIENHLRICNYRSTCCPYLNIGCNSSNMHAGNVIDHLQLEIVNHTKLLIDCIDNLNNEMERLKIIVDKFGEENKMLKCEINEMKLDGEKKQMKYDEQMREIDLLNKDMVALRNVDKYTRDDVDELKLDGKGKKVEIDKLNKKLQEIELKFEIKSKSKMENEINKLKLDGQRKQIEIDKLNKKLQEIESKFEIESISNIEKEIDQLKLDGERKEKELETKCAEQTDKIDLLNEEIVKLRNVDKCTREDVDKLKLDGERNKKSIGTLGKKCEEKNKEQIEQLNKKYQERENKEKDLMRNEIDEMRNKQTEMRTMSNRIDQTMKNVENKLLEIEIINQNKMINGEFVWRIDKINDKMKDAKNGINREIYSDSFYAHKHGYKMCLSVNPDGYGDGKGTHLSVWFYLMKGEFDDILQWPFKYDVTFSLVNQQTRLDHLSDTRKYNNLLFYYNKPIKERNGGFGFYKFIELQELSTNANLTRNNQIFIKCSVNISS